MRRKEGRLTRWREGEGQARGVRSPWSPHWPSPGPPPGTLWRASLIRTETSSFRTSSGCYTTGEGGSLGTGVGARR